MRRRTYLATTTAATVALAGCLERPDEETDADGSDGDSDADTDGSTADGDADEYPALVGTFDDFESIAGWSVVAGTASVTEGQSFVGSQSILLELRPDDSYGQTRLARELDDPIDCTGVSPGLAVALADDDATAPLIQLLDSDGNRIDYRSSVVPGLNFVRVNFGVVEVDPEFHASDVTEIQLGYIDEEGTSGRLWIDDLHFVPRPADGTVLVQFDGGYETHRTRALPVLEAYDIPATAFVSTDRLRENDEADGDRLTAAQLAELDDAGWTIGSHTATDRVLTDLEDDEREAQVRDAQEWLGDNGYEDGAAYFSYPAGEYDAASLDVVDEYHDLAFGGRFPVQGYATNLLRWQRVVDPAPAEAQEMLDLTAELGGITTLAYVELGDESFENFQETMTYLAALEADGNVEIVTPGELEDEYVYGE